MKKKFQWLFLISLLITSLASQANDHDYKAERYTKKTHKNYKGEVPTTKYYKGLVASGNDVTNAIPANWKYGGQVYSSEMYQGDLEGAGYYPTTIRSLHDGAYIGIEGGYDSYMVRNSINTVVGGVSVFHQNPQLNAVGATGSLFGGYGRYFDYPLYVGAEVFYNLSGASTSENVGLFESSGNYYIKSSIQGNFGISLLPGVKLSDSTLLYLRGGYTRLEIKTIESSPALSVNNTQSNGVNGVHYGLGIETDIYKTFSVRGEYTHLSCQSIHTATGTKVTPSNNQFMLGLVYHFF